MQSLLEAKNLSTKIKIDSAGTGDWHVGHLPDARMRKHCEARGYAMEMRARQFLASDFEDFDLILAMDSSNYKNIAKLASSDQQRSKIKMMCSYATAFDLEEVPDPYYGGAEGFELVIDLLEDSCAGRKVFLSNANFDTHNKEAPVF